MQPYKLVKDQRSSWETSDVQGVLDGGFPLEDCIGDLLRWKAKDETTKFEQEQTMTCITIFQIIIFRISLSKMHDISIFSQK